MEAHYKLVVKGADSRVKRALRRQENDPEHRFYGGVMDTNDLVEAKYTIYRFTTMLAAYSCKESAYFEDPTLYRAMERALLFVERVQNEDGLFDYIDCNFHSAPDTAFCLKRLMPALWYLRETNQTASLQALYETLYKIAHKAAQGLLLGGFHTPNHRWAITAALLDCGKFFEEPALCEAAGQYLLEGIDCNGDGEFAERSAGNYNRINNDAMLTIGDCTGDPAFHQYAVRNLKMMLTYLEPDGSIFTANSTRQDNGKRIFPKDYYLEYLRMGLEQNIPEFLDMANYIFFLVEENHLSPPDILLALLRRPDWRSLEHTGLYEQREFSHHYKESGILRQRGENFTLTLMREKSGFLYLSAQKITLALKIGISFCEHRAFVPETLEFENGSYTLTQTMKGWYYLPFSTPQGTADWWAMDHSKREKRLGPDLSLSVKVTPLSNGVDVAIAAKGVSPAPLRVEIGAVGAVKLENEGFIAPATPGGALIARSGTTAFVNEEERISVGPGFGTHASMFGKFGSAPADPNTFTLYCTDFTELSRTLQFRCEG